MSDQSNAVVTGVLEGVAAAAPAVIAASNPAAAAAIQAAAALAPAITALVQMAQAGLIDQATLDANVKSVTDNVASLHTAWQASIAAHPGT